MYGKLISTLNLFTFFLDEKSNKKIKTAEKKLKIYMAVNDMLTCAN